MIVSDTSPLIFLARLGRLEFLKRYEIVIPEEVYREVQKGEGREDFFSIEKFIREGKIKIEKVEIIKDLPESLHEGERAVISLAMREKAEIVLLDERKARIIAKLYNLTPRGTIGVIREEYLKGRITKSGLKKLVLELVKRGYRIREEILSEFLESL